MIYVCGLEAMPRHVAALRLAHLISLVAPDEQPPTPAGIRSERHLRVSIHDISEPIAGSILPAEEHVTALVAFLRECRDDGAVLMHCVAGISRSMAGALIALCLDAEGREAEAGRRLRQLARHAHPNRRMIEVADRLLGRGGRLIAAREAMGPPAEVLLSGPLVRVPRPL